MARECPIYEDTEMKIEGNEAMETPMDTEASLTSRPKIFASSPTMRALSLFHREYHWDKSLSKITTKVSVENGVLDV